MLYTPRRGEAGFDWSDIWPEEEAPPTTDDLDLMAEGWIYLGNGCWKRKATSLEE
jgi:hypothetical protein